MTAKVSVFTGLLLVASIGLAQTAPAGDVVDVIFQDRFKSPGFTDCPDCPTMVMIPAGSFVQGSPPDEPQSLDRERPQRTVNIPAFAMGQTEVTIR